MFQIKPQSQKLYGKEQTINQTYKAMVEIILRAANKAIPENRKRFGKPFWKKRQIDVQERNKARREAEVDKSKVQGSLTLNAYIVLKCR